MIASTKSNAPRFDRLDALRGVAIVWMAVFHFCFDLAYFGVWKQDFYRDPVWTVQRTCIVSLFLFCAGLGQAVALRQGQGWPRFWHRWAQVAGCALLVSAGSVLMFPKSWISFGVLHGIAVMLIVMRFAAPLGAWLWPLGVLAIALPQFAQHPFFDSRWTHWIGLVTHKPITEDYVPLLPWLGVMAFGLAAGQWLIGAPEPAASRQAAPRGGQGSLGAARRFLERAKPGMLQGPLARPLHPLAALGRWSLSFYMVHQPVLIGLVMATLALTSR